MVFGTSSFTGGFLVGFGAGFLSRELLHLGVAAMRPLSKVVIRTGLSAYERGRESVAYFTESFEDLIAEVRSDLRTEAVAEGEAKEGVGAKGTIKASAKRTKTEPRQEQPRQEKESVS